ncbi:hypothetical protein WA026_015868 [Henosepilachna vigintioctopunctata]|uniref:Uncharacterized protein n=1 Tax=Henosepilachna vigintioctopunctata TaxID=420089 RepID=A0AAW1V2P5_9CUCU
MPIDKWDTIKVDFCLDQGQNIYNHADDLCATEKRIIKNILIRNHFFDIILKKIQIINYSQNKDMNTGIDTLFGRRYSYFIVQMVGCCNVIYKGENCYYLFDPYAIDRRGRAIDDGQAGWIKYRSLNQVKGD